MLKRTKIVKLLNASDKIDEVLVSVFRAHRSYTGEEMAEISCHGGVSPVTAIFNLLLKSGFRTALPGEFTFRAFVNGKTDLTKSEAVKEIIDSKTDTSRSLAAGRLSGNLYNEIQSIKEKINLILSEATGQELKKVQKDTDRDYYMSAEEALKYGLIDGILDKNGKAIEGSTT